MQFGDPVRFNDGENANVLAFVRHVDDSGNLDLVVLGAAGVQYKDNVPRRDPSDYGPEGGGHTWHPAG